MKVHDSLATYHGRAAAMNKRCAMWLPTFLQRGIHFFGERTEVFALNNFVLFDRVHLPIIGRRAAVVEEDLLPAISPPHLQTLCTSQDSCKSLRIVPPTQQNPGLLVRSAALLF